jgi:hypothetical protein
MESKNLERSSLRYLVKIKKVEFKTLPFFISKNKFYNKILELIPKTAV